jgi:MEDS: MEthanogen/methylotroph, DcmR Sensory domain
MFLVLNQGDFASHSSLSCWEGISSNDHFVQIYQNDRQLLETLESYVVNGIRAGESVVVIATPAHRRELERRLKARGIDVDEAKESEDYIALDASEVLGTFLKDGWPDEDRLRETLSIVFARARKNHKRIRIFGEMVAVLWSLGKPAATLRLERLWNAILEDADIPLFCAYPKNGFNDSTLHSLELICSAHSQVLLHQPLSN